MAVKYCFNVDHSDSFFKLPSIQTEIVIYSRSTSIKNKQLQPIPMPFSGTRLLIIFLKKNVITLL